MLKVGRLGVAVGQAAVTLKRRIYASRSEVRVFNPQQIRSKGTFLMNANVLATLKPEQKDELFSRLFMSRNELRLVVFGEGKIPNDAALNSILDLPNVRLTSDQLRKNQPC